MESTAALYMRQMAQAMLVYVGTKKASPSVWLRVGMGGLTANARIDEAVGPG